MVNLDAFYVTSVKGRKYCVFFLLFRKSRWRGYSKISLGFYFSENILILKFVILKRVWSILRPNVLVSCRFMTILYCLMIAIPRNIVNQIL